MYQVLARKWRPKNFHELVGQQHITQALTYALDNDRIHHAYLFTGTRGVGKTTIARIFAKSLNCQTHGVSAEPCGTCEHCREIDQGRFPDLIEVDAASRTSVDDTRELLDNVPYTPIKGRYKVYLIDEVHMFSRSSFNALLKTLEEPPPHAKFILATTDPQKLPATVLSRCLQFHLKNMTVTQIVAHLQTILNHDSVEYEVDALHLLAEAGMGSMRDSLSLLDQAIAYGRGAVKSTDVAQLLGAVPTRQLRAILHALTNADAPALRQVLHTLDEFSPDYQELLKKLLYQLQEITIVQLDAERYSGEIDEDMRVLASRLPIELVQLWYQIATDGWQNLAYQPDIRLAVEMILLRMIALRPLLPTQDSAALPDIPAPRPIPEEEPVNSLEEMQVLLDNHEGAEYLHQATSETEISTDVALSSTADMAEELPPWVDDQYADYGQQQEVLNSGVVVASSDEPSANMSQSHLMQEIPHDTDTLPAQIATPHYASYDDAGQSMYVEETKSPQENASENTQTTASSGSLMATVSAQTMEAEVIHPPSSVTTIEPVLTNDQTEQKNEPLLNVDFALCIHEPKAWADVVTQLDLPGEVGAMAEHCVVLAWQPPILTLGLSEGAMMFADNQTQQALSAALSAVIDAPCQIQCQIDTAQDTPAILQEQALAERQKQAEAAIYNHPTVKQLQNHLGAIVVPGSIVSLTKEHK